MALVEWPEVRVVLKEKRCEIILQNIDSSRKKPSLDDEELQASIFCKDSPLNLISIERCSLSTLHSSIVNCTKLTKLVLKWNKLSQLPEEIGLLPKLNFLDVSHNQLTSLPKSFSKLATLETLNVSNNKLTDDGLFDFSELIWVHILNFSNNSLTKLPTSIAPESLVKLNSINFSHNSIEEIPDEYEELYSRLKHIDLSSNELQPLPKVLALFEHVKNLDLSGNPFEDRRFRKLANDSRSTILKMLDYLRKQTAKESYDKTRKKRGDEENEAEEGTGEEETMEVRTGVPEASVRRLDSVSIIRPYLACCILRNLDLTGENFRNFISIQTRLHSSICVNRTVAAIGTHELQSVALPLRYLALPQDELHITCLHKKTPINARQLLTALMTDAELARKRQKRNTLNPLHRYLNLVKDLSHLPCLIDANGLIISLPPVTNSDLTKMTESTTSVLIEVSSNESIAVCKEVMNQLVMETLKICPQISIDQMRVSTENDDLLCAFPDKIDLPELAITRVQYKENTV